MDRRRNKNHITDWGDINETDQQNDQIRTRESQTKTIHEQAESTHNTKQQTCDLTDKSVKLKEVYIIGDEYAKNCSYHLRGNLINKFKIQGIVKTNSSVENIYGNIFSDTKHLGESDFIIVMVNTSNISNHKALNDFLKNIFNAGKYTNVLLLLKCNNWDDEKICHIVKRKFLLFQRNNFNCSISLKIDYSMKHSELYGFIRKFVNRTKCNNKCVLKSVECIPNPTQEMNKSQNSFLDHIETINLEI